MFCAVLAGTFSPKKLSIDSNLLKVSPWRNSTLFLLIFSLSTVGMSKWSHHTLPKFCVVHPNVAGSTNFHFTKYSICSKNLKCWFYKGNNSTQLQEIHFTAANKKFGCKCNVALTKNLIIQLVCTYVTGVTLMIVQYKHIHQLPKAMPIPILIGQPNTRQTFLANHLSMAKMAGLHARCCLLMTWMKVMYWQQWSWK